MENLLSDIRAGFHQRKCAEMALTKNKRGKKLEVWQNGVPTSEDELSHCNSPRLSRRRMGSFSGPLANQGEGQPGENSPDVTPNGSLRRRRSRVPSEEDDNKLMDYLHTAGHDGSRERKSWSGVGVGVDRSFPAMLCGRPDPTAASEVGRGTALPPLHPGPSTTPLDKPAAPRPAQTQNWRQKIESWFKENEREERQSEELKRRLHQHRKSLDLETAMDEGGGGGVAPPSPLSTLPEDRPSDTPAAGYRRVYDDWKPSVDKTDVGRVMEAIEEAHTPIPSKQKDKSLWRKSNLNVANSCEAASTTTTTTASTPSTATTTTASRRLKRMRSRSNIEPGQVVQAVQGFREEDEEGEEDGESSRRSSLIKSLGRTDTLDTLKMYIRRPSQEDGEEDEEEEGQEGSGRKAPAAASAPAKASAKALASPSRSEQLIQKYRDSVDVSADVLRSIEEAEPRAARSVPAGRRGERRTPHTPASGASVRSALQQRLRDNLQPRLAGAIRSLGPDVEEEEAPRPPSVPRHLRRLSREEMESGVGGGEKLDKIDIDAENIETPPATRRALGGRSFRGLSSEGRRALTGEARRGTAPRVAADSSEGEGGASEAEGRGTQRLRRLADLARDGDSETETMLARQGSRTNSEPALEDDGLGDGRFERFSSVRKTLRHRREPRSTPDRAASPAMEEDSATRLRRWQHDLTEQQGSGGEGGGAAKSPDSWRDRITRKFRPGEKYEVAAAAAASQPRAPASERLPRRNKEAAARAADTRGSFRGLSSTRSTGGGSGGEGERKRSVFGEGARGVGKLFSRQDTGQPRRTPLESSPKSTTPSSPRASGRSEPRGTLSSARSASRSSLVSSRSSLTSAASVSTVRPARPPSRSTSASSVAGTRAAAPPRGTAATTSRGLGLRGLGRAGTEDYEGTQSSPATPKGEAAPATFPEHGRSSGSLHSSGGAATPARPLSRADSARSTGSLSKQSSEGSLRRPASRPGTGAASSRSKRPLAPAQVRPLAAADNRVRATGGGRSTAGGTSGTKVRRGDSGSSKENLSRSSSGNSRAPAAPSPAPAKTAVPPRPGASQRRPAGTTKGGGAPARKGGAIPAFMRPTTASSSKGGGEGPPRGKGRAATTPPRPAIK
ncbi:hypothetical protein GWK47_030969 [Chionoecetes opilio]|uniref:Uncharacterized protein n=1 Tax=Chionoecetes opilio TaxID=41210 RepID=A0A8J5D4Z4_CHIOP|nr:hypothetical protein GWK47_030969 [Chionoecetes opilio]